jgi:dihydrofolate synthase/folylpolyglutamate synthase
LKWYDVKRNRLSYKEALRSLYRLQKYGIKFGLSKTSNLLQALGNPHHHQRYIHIAGSNGKGSVAAMLESVLIKAGYKVGFYSSPHLARFTERFRIDGQEIRPERAASIAGEVLDVIAPAHPPTFFETTTAMALLHFAGEETDIAIMETGMGGRLDATNVITPLISVITNISLEHQHFLGSRLLDIAAEKAGIIKGGVGLMTGAKQPEVISFLRARCRKAAAPFWRLGKDVRYRMTGSRLHYYGFKHRIGGLELGLEGGFQGRNGALALAVVELLEGKGFEISAQHMAAGLRHAHWPGRMQVLSRRPLVILDGAHNPAAARELVRAVRHGFCYQRLILVIGVMADKDLKGMVTAIIPAADYVIFTKPVYYRSAPPERLAVEAAPYDKPAEIRPVISDALERAKGMARPEDLILVCGSLFTVGEALTCLDPERYRPDPVT